MAYTISKSDLISDIAQKSPRAIELLTEYGLSCATCFLNSFDNLEAGAVIHGMGEKELEQMIEEINTQLKKESKDG